jgi:alginate O-acetyltransferase complex protein AlgI
MRWAGSIGEICKEKIRYFYAIMINYLLLALPYSVLTLLLSYINNRKISAVLPYLLFFSVPVLTYSGVIGTLTGFEREGTSPIFFGITFYAVFLAYHLAANRVAIQNIPIKFILLAINPFYLFTGPIPNSIQTSVVRINLKNIYRRFKVIHSDLIVGVLYCFILSTPFKSFFYLRDSTNLVDILLFGIIFEFYVYFNFAGFSMIAWSFMRILGINVQRNFNQPFSAKSLIDYWKRWHISLGTILKEIYFNKFRAKLSLYPTVLIVFLASAFWHGIALNFLLWGLFHGILWCFSHFFTRYNKIKFINLILLYLAIIIGRVIFAENRVYLLISKLYVLLNFPNWNSDTLFQIPQLGIVVTLFIPLVIILIEIFSKKLPFGDDGYAFLKIPSVSTILLLYTILFLSLHANSPIYGNR